MIPTLWACLHRRAAPALWTPIACSSRSMSFLCWSPRPGCSTPGGVWREQSRGAESLPLLLPISTGHGLRACPEIKRSLLLNWNNTQTLNQHVQGTCHTVTAPLAGTTASVPHFNWTPFIFLLSHLLQCEGQGFFPRGTSFTSKQETQCQARGAQVNSLWGAQRGTHWWAEQPLRLCHCCCTHKSCHTHEVSTYKQTRMATNCLHKSITQFSAAKKRYSAASFQKPLATMTFQVQGSEGKTKVKH